MYVRVTCLGCGRVAVFSAFDMHTYAKSLKQSTELRALGPKMVCTKERGGCGHKGASLVPIDWPPPQPTREPMTDLLQEAKWERERKRARRH